MNNNLVMVRAKLFGGQVAVVLPAIVTPYRNDPKVVRLRLTEDDPGRLEQAAIIGSCVQRKEVYRWEV
jgi:hypothetical protein